MPRHRAIAFAAAILLTGAPAFAQSTADRPDDAPPAQGQAAAPGTPSPGLGAGMMGPGMMGSSMMGRGMMGPGMMGPGMMGPGMMMNMTDGMASQAMGRHVEGRLAFVKTELKITDAQASQWNAFADAVRENATSMAAMHRSVSSRSNAGTLPERLAQQDKVLTEQLAALKKTEEALDKLYGVLSPEQQKLADGIVLGPMGMPMGMM